MMLITYIDSIRPTRLRSAHTITRIDGLLWTLVITGPRRHHWGFWTMDGFQEWEQYTSRNVNKEYRK